MIRKIFFIFFTCFTLISAAQKNDSLRFSINIIPQYLFINGIRGDIAYQFSDKINAFVGLQYYTGNINSSGSETRSINSNSSTADQSKRANDILNGNGWNCGFKYYFLKEGLNNYYVGGDITYNKFNITMKDYDYFPYVDDGLTFYEYRLGELEGESTQTGYHFTAGVTVTKKRFIVNGWLGIGYTETKSSKNLVKYRKYDSYIWQYAYQGFAPYIGAKVGFLLF